VGDRIHPFEHGGISGASILEVLFHLLFGTHPNWPDTMEVDAELEVANRNILLARVNASDALVLTWHMPFPGMGFISEQGNGYRWMPASS